jgi:hypothetical protein
MSSAEVSAPRYPKTHNNKLAGSLKNAETFDKMVHFVDTRKGPAPFGAAFRGLGQGKLSTK